jgi:hypothetical protein
LHDIEALPGLLHRIRHFARHGFDRGDFRVDGVASHDRTGPCGLAIDVNGARAA